ncbi:MAG: phosphatase PAP2 family protein [Ancalomicrobiaceae bacterium]|nr:phosphatase PAP2 family protein [Ancalomicrobiaceae bacterium]
MTEPVIHSIWSAAANAASVVIDEAKRYPIAASVGATAAVSALFLSWPQIDTGVAGLFHVPNDGFPMARVPLFLALRNAGLSVTQICTFGLVAASIARLVLPRLLSLLRPSVLAFLVASLAIGPGLIVNVILKDYWGRARPIDTNLFGGAHAFSLPWEISDACARNCSFPSGEASGSFWLIAFAFVVPESWRRNTIRIALAWAALISFNRLAFGGHYLSDVLIAWGIVMSVIVICRELILFRYAERIDAGGHLSALRAKAKALWLRYGL